MSITFYPNNGSESGYGDPIYVIDAFQLYEECNANNITTGWWFPLANSSTLVAGEYPSEAYILVTKKYLDGCAAHLNNGIKVEPISRTRYNHKLVFNDAVRTARGEDPFSISGWVFHSATAIDGTNDPADLDAVYLVKFVDKRWLFAKQPNIAGISGGLLYTIKGQDDAASFYGGGINVVASAVTGSTANDAYVADPDTVTYDPGILDDFPYVPDTTGIIESLSWQEALERLWFIDSFTDDYGSTLGFNSELLPPGGVFPDQNPIDFLFDNKSTWSLFCELLHASGNEIYPWLDGTFRILPIDDHFGSPSELVEYSPYLIEANHPQAAELGLPEYMTLTMRARSLGEFPTSTSQVNDYYTLTLPIPLTDPTPEEGLINEDELEIAEENGAYVLTGSDPVPESEVLVGVVEDVITPAMAFLTGAPNGINYTHVENYAKDVLARLIRSRADGWIDSTYGYFIGLSPSPEFEKISWFITPEGPATRFQSLPSTVGVDEIVSTPGGGGGGGGSDDHLVKADDDDDTPETFYTTVVDHDTFDEELHQEVFAEVVTESAGPPTNTRVKLFTTLGTGDQGPQGEQGEPGTPGPTYTDGCGIIVAGTVISFDPADVVGPGLRVDPFATTACSLAIQPSDLVGCGLEVASDNVANSAVKIKIAPADIVGCGLKVATDNSSNAAGPCKIVIDPEAIAGCGLMVASDNQADGNGPCKIKIDINTIKNPDEGIDAATGNQDDGNGPCKLKIKTNTTIKIPTSIELFQDGATLKVRLNYTNYEVYATPTGTTGSMSDTEATTECP